MDYNVYNYFLTNYSKKPVSKYDSHKSSELKSVMKSIKNITQSSPVYLLKMSEAKQMYALNIKDAAIEMNDTLSMLGDDTQDGVFVQKKAFSSDVSQVTAQLVTDDYDDLPEAPMIKVNRLATTQVNTGNEYYTSGKSLEAGTYRFRISVNDDNYDFQYNIKKDAKNGEVIAGLSDFITKAKIGLYASPVSREADKIMMRIESSMTGTVDGEKNFRLEDRQNGKGLVEYYNLNHVSSKPQNSSFELNGMPKTSLGNQFTLGRVLEITLNRTGEEAAEISYIPDSDKILDGIYGMLDSYNKLVDSTIDYRKESDHKSTLLREYRQLMQPFQTEMESCGITFDEEGHMKMENSLAIQAALEGDLEKLFGRGSELNQKLQQKNNEIKINPMDYVDKTIVCYPNFGKPPQGYSYITSMYSGMLFNYYC